MNRLGWTLILIGLGLWGSLFWQAWNGTVSTALGQPDEGETDKAKLAKLAGLRDADIHAPFDAEPLMLRAAGVTLGRTYPQPIVGHAEGRARALAAYAEAKAF